MNGSVVNNGTITPGASPGLMTIAGDFTQGSTGTLSLEIGGMTAGTQFDRLVVTGTAAFNGTLNVSLINGYVPALNDSFAVATFTSQSGQFATITGQTIAGGKRLVPTYNATNLTLTVAAALQAGQVVSDEWRVASNDLSADSLAAFAATNASLLIPRSRFGLVNDVEFIVTDLPNNLLGLAAGHVVWIDRDAAGFGWFVDSTPDTDEEFGLNSGEFSFLEAEAGEAAAGRMDLLTVLAHELGHLLGFEHDTDPGHLMSDTLAPGTRLLPIGAVTDIDGAFSGIDFL